MTFRMLLVACVAACIMQQSALADTTVAKTSREEFPYPEQVRLLIDKGGLFIECRNEYLDSGRIRAKPESVRYSLEKALKWSETNAGARVNIQKKVSSFVDFHGDENGWSYIFVRAGQSCMMKPANLRELLVGLRNNLDAARERDKQDAGALFD